MRPSTTAPPSSDIAIVGPCASGKSTLAEGLRRNGLAARQIAQEHSYVPSMWQILAHPRVLVYLHASYAACTARKNLDWTEREYQAQLDRLAHARQHCDILVDTDKMSPEQVLSSVLDGLAVRRTPGTV
jgi:cytidylate kinase